jgi:Fe-S oxidoreductase
VFITDCCGKPLYQLGTLSRAERNRENLQARFKRLGIKLLVTACPNCYYELQEALQGLEIKIVTVYEVLKDSEYYQFVPAANPIKCTIHDSCPDRFQGVFGRQVREALQTAGYETVEMAHNRTDTFCCGSGGQVSHFRPDFTEEVIARRIQEACDTGAETLVAYCLSCVLNFCKNPSGLKVIHVLNLLLNVNEDYDGLKSKAKEMFEGPEGEELWQKIMAEPERISEDE